MHTIRKFHLLLVLLIIAIFLLAAPNTYSQDSVSLGCCKTVKGTPACVGCGDGDLKCAIDGSLCDEYNSFTLGEVCIESELAGEAECRVAESASGCCVVSESQCSDDVAFDSCTGQHWFQEASCSEIPQCTVSTAKSSGFIDWIILAAAFVIVISLLIKFRRKRHG